MILWQLALHAPSRAVRDPGILTLERLRVMMRFLVGGGWRIRTMPDRDSLLGNLIAGDIFHAECPNGASMICVVVSVTETAIHARRTTTQEDLEFDRRTGVMTRGDGRPRCAINSVARLPVDIHEVFLGMDRKFRLEHDPERIKLSKAEQAAILFASSHYASNPL
jgi:hypothetical protein